MSILYKLPNTEDYTVQKQLAHHYIIPKGNQSFTDSESDVTLPSNKVILKWHINNALIKIAVILEHIPKMMIFSKILVIQFTDDTTISYQKLKILKNIQSIKYQEKTLNVSLLQYFVFGYLHTYIYHKYFQCLPFLSSLNLIT